MMKILSVDKPKTFKVELEVTEEEWSWIQNLFYIKSKKTTKELETPLSLTETQTKSSGTGYSKKGDTDDGTGQPFR